MPFQSNGTFIHDTIFFFFFFNFVRPNLMICLCNVKIDQRNLSFNLEDAISELSILALFKLFYDDGVELY